MSILDETFVFHPDSWKDWDWKSLSGLPLGEVSLTAADGAQLFGWYVEGRQVFAAAKPPKSFSLIEGAEHNSTDQVGGAAYFQQWAEFVPPVIRW
ncbi:MAG: hypothetical protein JW394_0101 [Nitrospira sp.]|nr:hypothetical protein [Nitrospira sp.]